MLSPEDESFVVEMYDRNLMTMIGLAERFGVTRQWIYRVLKRNGSDTRKRKLEVECYWCGKVFERAKARLRKNVRNFCCDGCYIEWLNELGADYIPDRHGSRLARAIVGRYFELSPENVVHHEDKDQRNNMLHNLKVFANSGDHVRYHRKIRVEPLWDGRFNAT